MTGVPADGQERVFGPVHTLGLTLRRKVWVANAAGGGFVRYFDTVTNNSTATQVVPVRIGSNFVEMSNGISSISPNGPEWVVRRNDVDFNYPTWAEVFGSALDAPLFASRFVETTRSHYATYTLVLQPGETRAFVRVLFQRTGDVDGFSLVENEAVAWTSLGNRLLDGLSIAERAQIVNFRVP